MTTFIHRQDSITQPAFLTAGEGPSFTTTGQKLHHPDAENRDEDTLKILVVEDEPINQRVAQIALETMGYQIDIAPNGQAALTLYQANDYAAILMDMGLPDIPGTEVTRQIRRLEQGKVRHMPIIALTANGLGAKTECLAAGMDDFSVKPFEFEVLRLKLERWIKP